MQKTLRSLSCDETGTKCFLSCVLRTENHKPNTPNSFLKRNAGLLLSCENDKLLESNLVEPIVYRASGQTASKSQKEIRKKPDIIVGIDPGITGAIAFIDSNGPKFISVHDFPLKETLIGKRLKNRIDIEDFSLLIESYAQDINCACVEEVGQIGTNADPFSSFVFGFATGLVHGVLSSHGIKIHVVKPLIWKGALGLDANKEKSLEKAKKLFPESTPHLSRKKDHGRAEALLLAYFAWKLGGGR